MEIEASLFETSEMLANFLASTPLLWDSWPVCAAANATAPGGFVVNWVGSICYMGFSGVQDVGSGSDSDLEGPGMVAVGGAGDAIFSALGRNAGAGDGDGGEEGVMVHAVLLQLFLGMYGNPSFQNQMQEILQRNRPIILTGHSIGGALASLTALWLLSTLERLPSSHPPVLCITFGSPLFGNRSLSKAVLRQRWAGNFCHVVLNHDIVPRLLFAPLSSLNTQLHCLLQYWHLSMRQHQLSSHVPEEMKVQLFSFVLAYNEAVAENAAKEEKETGKVFFWPFGNYLFCSDEGAVCVDNGVAVVKLLHLMLAMAGPSSCMDDHLKYGECVGRISQQFLKRKGFMQEKQPGSSYEAGLQLALESSGLASQESLSEPARDCLRKVKQMGLTPNLNSAKLAISLSKITPYRAQIEWYKSNCDESDDQMGYYDSFKRRQASKRDNQVNLFRIKLACFWNTVIDMIDDNKLPHDFHKRAKWVNAAHFYQLLVEPLDIAEYYRSGLHLKKGHYLKNGRERRHEVFDRWWRERNPSEQGGKKRSTLASLTQDSCFWARAEEARELTKKVRNERNSRMLWEHIEEFERYARFLIENKEISKDVLARNSGYSLWVEELRELRSQVLRFPLHLPGLLDGKVVP